MLKPFVPVDCDPVLQSTIQTKTVEFVKNNTDLFQKDDVHLWNKVNAVDVLRAVPELSDFYRGLGLQVRDIAFTVINKYKDAPLHIDELPVVAKINFPILNTEHTYNEWYEIPEELMNTVKPTINTFGSEHYNLKNINLDQCKCIGKVELLQPVIFNSQIPHKIRISEHAQLPRIVLSSTFVNEPIDWLQ